MSQPSELLALQENGLFSETEPNQQENSHDDFKRRETMMVQNEAAPVVECYGGGAQETQQAAAATIQRPAGSFRVVRRPGDYEPAEHELLKVEKRLPEDTFSMIMISSCRTLPFFFGVLISVFQLCTYVLVLVDVIDLSDRVNPFGIPANVDVAVRIAQVIALIILIPLQDEVIEGLVLINDGYQKEALEAKFAGTSENKFVFSVCSRLLVGMLSIVTSFLLIIIEPEVLGIFFNFIALQFINDLDNLSFQLGAVGIIGSSIQAGAHEVSDISYFTNMRFRRRCPLVMVFLMIMGAWVWVLVLQQRGHFVSTSIEVQFGDDLVPALAAFSGIYDRSDWPSDAGRFRYVNRHSQTAFFGYCEKKRAWTFTYDRNDPCDFQVVSSQTETYEITDTELWSVGTKNTYMVPVEPFFMSCFMCADKKNPCQHGGVYTRGECHCPRDRVGRRCRVLAACPKIFLDKGDEYIGPRDMPTDYEAMLDNEGRFVTMYAKPIFVDPIWNGLVLFNGRRWCLTSLRQFNLSSASDFSALIANGWHPYSNPVSCAFISDPSDIGSLTDLSAPLRFHWYRASTLAEGEVFQRPLYTNRVASVFDCAVCNAQLYPCMFGNPCINGTCQCHDGSAGSKCQLTPLNDGKCDVGFNKWDFSFDSGDCCRASCTSSLHHYCGYSGKVEVGFPDCADHAFSCDPGQRCWALDATELELVAPRGWDAEKYTVIKMSPNGRTMVLAYPTGSVVQVFDQMDSLWVQRGDNMIGRRGSLYGYAIALSTAHGSILDFIAEPVDLRMAIGAFDPNVGTNVTGIVNVMSWDIDSFVPLGPEIRFTDDNSLGGTFFDFFGNGRFLAVQVDPTTISVVDLDNNGGEVATISCLDLNISCGIRSFVAVSEKGSFLLRSSSSEVFHVTGTLENFSSSEWTATLVSTNAEWCIMSKNGLVIATIGAYSTIIHFYVMGEDNLWTNMGSGIALDRDWAYIKDTASFSVDGLTIAFALRQVSGMGHKVEVFRFDEQREWYQLGNTIETDTVPTLSTSYDASLFTIVDNSVRTFRISPFCQVGESYVRIFLILAPNQSLVWSLGQPAQFDRNSSILRRNPDYHQIGSYRKILEEICVPQGQCMVLKTSEVTHSLNQSLLSVRIDNEEVLHVIPVNDSYALGNCEK